MIRAITKRQFLFPRRALFLLQNRFMSNPAPITKRHLLFPRRHRALFLLQNGFTSNPAPLSPSLAVLLESNRNHYCSSAARRSSEGALTTTNPAAPAVPVDEDDENCKRIEWLRAAANIVRDGPNDKIVSVRVGDKEFRTLKSTILASPTMRETLLNQELRSPPGNDSTATTSIFIDRDPKHFPTILMYLRNKAEGITIDNSERIERNKETTKRKTGWMRGILEKKKKYGKYVRLPKESDDLEDLYVEADYYRLDDLQNQLAHCSVFATVISYLRGNKRNPFEDLKVMIQNVRTAGLVLLGTGTTLGSIKIATAEFFSTANASVASFFAG